MRKSFLAIGALLLTAMAASAAEQAGHRKSDNTAASGKLLPLKRATSGNSCAAYGAGFMKVEGTGTCVKIGGAVSIGVGTSAGSR
jgi:hypothetical protein